MEFSDSKEFVEWCVTNFATKTQVAKFYGLPVSVVDSLLKKYGYCVHGRHLSCSIKTKVEMAKKLFVNKSLNEVESYLYGYYLGDGTSKDSGCLIVECADRRDFVNFERLELLLDVGEFIKTRFVGDLEIKEMVFPKEISERLTKQGLLWASKSRVHPDLPKDLFDRVDFFMCLRGIIDSDGCVRTRGQSQYLKIEMTWPQLIVRLRDELEQRGVKTVYKVRPPGKKGTQDVHTLVVNAPGVLKLVELGLYDYYPNLCVDRKRLLGFRKPVVIGNLKEYFTTDLFGHMIYEITPTGERYVAMFRSHKDALFYMNYVQSLNKGKL